MYVYFYIINADVVAFITQNLLSSEIFLIFSNIWMQWAP